MLRTKWVPLHGRPWTDLGKRLEPALRKEDIAEGLNLFTDANRDLAMQIESEAFRIRDWCAR
jgi:hypothetical protein